MSDYLYYTAKSGWKMSDWVRIGWDRIEEDGPDLEDRLDRILPIKGTYTGPLDGRLLNVKDTNRPF
jgi:hypothetical protein